MGFIESIKTCFLKYFVFSGRASRSEFWWFQLFVILFVYFGIVLDVLFIYGSYEELNKSEWGGTIANAYSFLIFTPLLAANIRRLHDVNKSGWWVGFLYFCFIAFFVAADGIEELGNDTSDAYYSFLVLVSITGIVGVVITIIVLIWSIKKSDKSSNKYGPKPVK